MIEFEISFQISNSLYYLYNYILLYVISFYFNVGSIFLPLIINIALKLKCF